MLNTLEKHGIPAASQPSETILSEYSSDDDDITDLSLPPKEATKEIDSSMWVLSATSSVNEYFLAGYYWQALKIRSPVMWTQEASFTQIQLMVNLLTSNYRLRVNPTCNFSVRVGNGMGLFTAATIKRIGAFLWAADPMFSRLHAPWRRVHDSGRSIRLDSNLAHGTTAEQVSEKWEGGWLKEYDPIPVTDFSDTSKEEKEHGSKERWEQFARWRNEVGPFMTLGEDIDDIDMNGSDSSSSDKNDSDDDDEWRTDSSDGTDGSEIHLPLLEDVLAEGHRALAEDQELHIPPDPNTLHRNIGWAFWDETQDKRLVTWLYEYCQENFGHSKLYKLPGKEQVSHMLSTQCAVLFGHTDVRELDADQEYEVLIAASRYFEAGSSSWEWNKDTERWDLAWRRVGNIIKHPAAHREIKIDAPAIIQKFENLAKLTDLHSEDNELGIQYISPEDYEVAASTNKGVERLLHDLKDYAEPLDPNFRKNLQDPRKAQWFDDEKSPQNSSVYSTKTEVEKPCSQVPLEGFDPDRWQKLMKDIRKFGRIAGMRSEHSSDSTSSSSVYSVRNPSPSYSSSSDDRDNYADPKDYFKAKHEHMMKYIRSCTTPIREPEVALRPHNPSHLKNSYRTSVNKYVNIAEEEWNRIGHHFIDPKVTVERGVAEISSSNTAAGVAELLTHEGLQLNYDFVPYTLNELNQPQDPTHRGIDFREAGGSLDASWITTWARICTGVVRWAQHASVDEYLEVMDRIVVQERRELKKIAEGEDENSAKEQDEEGYDICCLLEDVGLFAEAAWVWKREGKEGPPR
ncbi:hypothetical protein F4805DRAFT_31775 [Annulohypoxylon moriforme]|nr:hypothetical protein F4805DRAFT_31775 [Annulohypoxylon moriforme]